MNLIIDIGNTSAKAAVMQGDKVIAKLKNRRFTKTWAEKILSLHPEVKRALVSNVAENVAEGIAVIRYHIPVHEVSAFSRVPFTNAYDTPETLGTDRMANAAALVSLYPEQNSLCVDIGTCVKFDFCTAEGAYQGGSISPGISLRFQAMNDYTRRLPLLTGERFPPSITGENTRNSMRSGVFYGMLHEIDGMIASYREQYTHLQVVITGGDAQHFVPALKSDIFARPDFTLLGLNKILELNA
ncbi:MAG: type III pantothenate kinase [Bacteroidota bacterium]